MKRSTLAAVCVAAIITLTLLGLRACANRSYRNTPGVVTPSPARSNDKGSVGPTRTVHGVPAGWRHDQAGARAAAMSAVHLTGPIAKAGFITRSDMIGEIATGRFAPTLAKSSVAQLGEFMVQVGSVELTPGDLIWDELPLTAMVTRPGADRERVQVWSVLVVGAPGVGVPRQAWRTVTVDVAWERGDWKVAGWLAEPGPTPVLADPTGTASIEAVREVTGWPIAAGSGGG
ncbi:MAG: hypothetical protein M3137_00510 [Actinomycetota bacterium]|nr:hypothetical protein [Actinomycetota bacterium]